MGFRNGLIVTQANDTIMCLVPMTLSFGNKVQIKRTAESEEETIPIHMIKYLATETNVYENIIYHHGRKEINKLMWLELEGKLNLYLEVAQTAEGFKNHYRSPKGGYTTESNPPLINTYVIKKAGSTFLIEEKNFLETIKLIILDNAEVLKKVESKTYSYSNIELLVKDYNNTSNTD
jgi:hypothetical protein